MGWKGGREDGDVDDGGRRRVEVAEEEGVCFFGG